VHEDHPKHCYDERYLVIATKIISNKFIEFDLKHEKKIDLNIKKPKNLKFPLYRFFKWV